MAQNKLEIQIKEKINSREIKPTEMAWDRLDAMLSVTEEKKSKKVFNWMSIAAVFIGLFLTGFVLFQLNSNDIQVNNSVVNQDTNTNKTENNSKIQNEIIQPNQEATSTNSSQIAEIKSSNNKKSIINQKTNQKQIIIENQFSDNKELVANNSTNEEIKIEPNLKVIPISVDVQKLLASVETTKKQKSTKSTLKVDAESMLAKAESGINPNYKETRFQKLKRNFEAVKTAVETRNIQE